jgi:hypothetical protein
MAWISSNDDLIASPVPSLCTLVCSTNGLAEGPFAYWFNDYGIWTTTLQFTNPPYPRPVRARNAGELTVGAQNMLRFLDNDPRLSRFSNHIRNVLGSPDVLAVSEVMSLDALTDLAEQLNFDDASLGYTAHLLEGHDIGGIDVGFLVRDSVSVTGAVAQLGANDTWIDPDTNAPALLNDRPPLLLRGSYINNGSPYPFAVIAVHQRSLIDVETSARVRAKRQAQAQALASYVQTLQTAEPGLRLVVTGDFNAFEFNDGYVDVMNIVTSGANLTNQVLTVASGDRYSYIENGVAQVLDHSLTSAPLNPYVRDFDFARANPDAPFASSPVSDHEGLVLFVMTDYPSSDVLQENNRLARAGTLEIAPAESLLTLFVWSKNRILPVRLTDFSIAEEQFDPLLNPIRAKVSLGMRVLSTNDLNFEHRGASLYLAYQQQKERLAGLSGRGTLAALGISRIG